MITLFKNGKVFINNTKFVTEFAIDDLTGKFVYVEGENKKPDYNHTIDLKQKLVIPAFFDAHCHLFKASQINSELNLRNAKTKSDFEQEILKYISLKNTNNFLDILRDLTSEGSREGLKNKINTNRSWITGGYYSDANIIDGFTPDINFLDQICPDNPIIISRFDFHSAYINSKAFELSGLINCIDKFEKEEIIYDEKGKFTGLVKERAREFVLSAVPVKSNEELASDLETEIKKLHSLGITAVSDITLPFDLDIFEILIRKNNLNLFIDSRLPFESFYEINNYKKRFSEFKNSIRFNGFKAFYDGTLSSVSALMHDNYIGTNQNGIRTDYILSGNFKKTGEKIHRAGYQISVHAIGDLAVTELLDFFSEFKQEKINADSEKYNRRHRIEHAQHIIDSDLERFRKLGVIASVQPTHLFSDAISVTKKYENLKTTHRYKQLIEDGATVCFGTDFPIVEENPFETIYYAMTRKAIGFENGFLPEYNISLGDCITCYTQNSSYASFVESERGSISVNKIADFLILEDLFQMPPESLRTQKPIETYLYAKKVF